MPPGTGGMRAARLIRMALLIQSHPGLTAAAAGYRTRLTTLHPSEAETLFLSGLPSALRDLGLSDAARTARLKLTATLLPSLRQAAESSVGRFHLDAPAWFREPATPPPRRCCRSRPARCGRTGPSSCRTCGPAGAVRRRPP